MSVRPSAGLRLQEAITETVAAQVKKLIVESDWDFTDAIIAPTLQYISDCREDTLREGCQSFYATTGKNNEAMLLYEISDVDQAIISERKSIFEIYDTQYTDCVRSQADLIFTLEDAVNELKASFQDRFGVPCEPAAIEAHVRERWPNVTYERPVRTNAAQANRGENTSPSD